MSEVEERHYLRNGGETLPDAREALEWASETRAAMVDLKFCDLLGTWQHVTLPTRAFDESAFDEGLGFDGSSIRGWQAIQDSDMLLMPDASSAILDPATEAPTLSLVCEIADPDHARAVREGSTWSRPPRGGAPACERYRRHRLLRPRVRVLRLRRGALRPRPELLALLGRLGRGLLELRQARPRLHGPAEGGVLPGRALGPAPRPSYGDGADARAPRHPVRVPSPRGRLGRPVRDRPPLHDADAHGRPGHDLQVRRQERRPAAREDRDLHAEADLRRQRLGDAHAPVAVDGGNAVDGGQVRLRGALPAGALVHRRAARPRSRPARLLRADDELVPAARPGLRGAGQSRLLAAQPLGVHPHPDVLGRRRRRSGSSSGRRTPPRTRIWRSRRC